MRLNKTAITINFNGLSHALPLADQADANSPLPIQILPAGYNGSAEVLIHTDFGHMGYSFDFTMRLPNLLFDVDVSGNIIDLIDDRATASGSTITFNTVSVKIGTPNPADTFRIYVKSTPVNSNVSSLSDLFTGDQDLKMVPIDNDATGVYYLRGSVTDARETFRIVYGGPGSFSLTTWTDASGTIPLT